jgi:protoporphyrinogen IX oxidase
MRAFDFSRLKILRKGRISLLWLNFGPMGILYIKALHIIFVVSWFAGLLYIIRLFIYQTEAEVKPAAEKKAVQSQLKIMANRLWTIITWPAAILATIFGYWMVYEFDYWNQPWMMVKLALTTLLWVYHIITHFIYKRLQNDIISWNSTQLRIWNEIATLWLVAIVFVVILKGTLNWIYGTLGFFLVGIVLMIGIRIYKRLRKD